jgi:hypothetical protein
MSRPKLNQKMPMILKTNRKEASQDPGHFTEVPDGTHSDELRDQS